MPDDHSVGGGAVQAYRCVRCLFAAPVASAQAFKQPTAGAPVVVERAVLVQLHGRQLGAHLRVQRDRGWVNEMSQVQ